MHTEQNNQYGVFPSRGFPLASGMCARSFHTPWFDLVIPLFAILPLIQVYLPHKAGPRVFPDPIHQASVQSCWCRWRRGAGFTVGRHIGPGLGYKALGSLVLVGYGDRCALWSNSSACLWSYCTLLLLASRGAVVNAIVIGSWELTRDALPDTQSPTL